MKKALAAFLLLWVGCQFAQAASATVTDYLNRESIEICHREGGTPETCGDLPMDDL